jgi:colanic acid/amylovoran biosynthesis glycosyltransferase
MSDNLLFMMPNFHAATEVWLWRMISLLEDRLKMIVVKDSAGADKWGNGVPVFSLHSRQAEIQGISPLLKRVGLELSKRSRSGSAEILQEIAKQSIDRILCQYGTFAVQNNELLLRSGLPLFIHFHGYDVFFDLCQADAPEKPVHPIDYLDNLKQLEKKSVFIAGSNFMKSKLVAAGFSENNIHVKYYGVPIPEVQKVHQKTEDLQILHLGRLVDFKSPDRTIKAFEIARSRGMKSNLVMVGNGPLKVTCELLRLRSPYKDSIKILDPIPPEQAQHLYLESDIYTQHNVTGEITNQAEGFGVSILEAMASGLPFVGTRSGGIVESVVENVTGILNDPEDVEAQAQSFLELARNPDLRQKMGDAGRKRVSEHFSPEQEKNRLIQIMGLSD